MSERFGWSDLQFRNEKTARTGLLKRNPVSEVEQAFVHRARVLFQTTVDWTTFQILRSSDEHFLQKWKRPVSFYHLVDVPKNVIRCGNAFPQPVGTEKVRGRVEFAAWHAVIPFVGESRF